MTYYRVQGGAFDTTELLDPERVSSAWGGGEHLDRPGVSVCASLDELAAYLAGPGAGIPYGSTGWVLIELDGEEIPDADPLDAADGEILIRPTRVVDTQPIPDALFDAIGRYYEESA